MAAAIGTKSSMGYYRKVKKPKPAMKLTGKSASKRKLYGGSFTRHKRTVRGRNGKTGGKYG